MDPEKLIKDELVYELKIRGFTNLQGETARSMRRQLAEVLRTEGFGVLKEPEGDFRPVVLEELGTCTSKVEHLEHYALSYKGLNRSSASYIDSKLKHLYGRLGRLQVDDTEENRPLLRSISNLMSRLENIEERVDQADEESRAQAQVVEVQHLTAATPVALPSSSVVNIHKHQYEPRKWGIKFQGQDGLSVAAFLEQVEIKRRSSHLSEAELLSCISDLLEGPAAVWYNSKSERIKSWSDFQCFLRDEFQPYFYQSELWDEIRARRQADTERVGIYFAFMSHLFNRLPKPATEEEKLEVLNKNVLPYYIENLGFATFKTVDELEGLLKRLERNRDIAEKRRTTVVQRDTLLEPDLAAPPAPITIPALTNTPSPPAGTSSSRPRPAVMAVEENRKCWNCQRVGHLFRRCRARRSGKFCFKCGRQGVVMVDCPKCSGNAQGGEATGSRLEDHPDR